MRNVSHASTGDVMAAQAHHDACAEVQNITSETLDILIVIRMALCADRGPLIEEEKDAVAAVLCIAEARSRAAHTKARQVADEAQEALYG